MIQRIETRVNAYRFLELSDFSKCNRAGAEPVGFLNPTTVGYRMLLTLCILSRSFGSKLLPWCLSSCVLPCGLFSACHLFNYIDCVHRDKLVNYYFSLFLMSNVFGVAFGCSYWLSK